ncbi:MAG: tyrosine-type recombinase/integrase [Devosia sp.]|uniref:tyrosine-type recombinase/integrase n=1 Tax=Devosia sp. TaxID=1871048 RepID=UPI00339B6707
MSSQDNLRKIGNTWHVVLELTLAQRQMLQKARFKRSLKTTNLVEANKRKHSYLDDFRRQLDEALRAQGDPEAAIRLAAAEYRSDLNSPESDRRQYEEDREDFTDTFGLEAAIEQDAKQIEEKYGVAASRRFRKEATGSGVAIKHHYTVFADEVQATEQTKSQHRSSIERFLGWAGAYTTIQETDRMKAGEYVSELLATSGLARRTIKRHLSSLSQFWEWLQSKGLVGTDVNPWLGHKLGKKPKTATRTALTDEQVVKLLEGTYTTPKYAQLLSDLTCIALLGGPRLDELCAMKAVDATKREDGYWLSITGGKTDAAIRDVPLHELASPIIERRLRDEDDYLFKGLTPGGPDNKRMWYVSKAYGRYRAQVGVKDRWQDFHALRHTFMTMMEGQEVPESALKLVVGHARDSMTFGHYSRGQRVKLRGVIAKVDYGPKVMGALRTACEATKQAVYKRRTKAEMASEAS